MNCSNAPESYGMVMVMNVNAYIFQLFLGRTGTKKVRSINPTDGQPWRAWT